MENYINLLWHAKEGAVATITYADLQVPERGFRIEDALNQACRHAIREKSLDHPLPEIHSAHPDTAASFRETAELRLTNMDPRPHNWDTYEKAIHLTASEARDYDQTGRPPEWFDELTMTVQPELRSQGYNIVNNGTIHPDGSEQALKLQLEHQMRLLMQQDGHEPGISKITFIRMTLRPMLDRQLASNIEYFDPPEANYDTDAGGSETLSNHQRLPYPGDTADPATHTQASYGRNLQERMAHTGLGESWSSQMLAWQIQYNLPSIKNMAQWGRATQERNSHDPASGPSTPPSCGTRPKPRTGRRSPDSPQTAPTPPTSSP